MANDALALEGVTRRFGSVTALHNVTMRVRSGTVHALLGENGAGKTTLMRIAFGMVRPDAGVVRVHGTVCSFSSPSQAIARGIGMVHQHFTLVPAMTVAENVMLGGHGIYSPPRAAARVRTLATRAGLPIDPAALVSTLSVGAQQRCEIIKALARDADLLILDEPTAVLAPSEAQELLRWIRAFTDGGRSVVLITHKLRDAIAIADDITVLRNGVVVLSSGARDTSESAIASAMLGGAMAASPAPEFQRFEPHKHAPQSRVVARAVNVVARDDSGVTRVHDASLDVHAGEIVGVAAIEGSGQHEFLRVLSGRIDPTQGVVDLPEDVGFVPEDRHRDALLLDEDLVSNIALRDAGRRCGIMPWNEMRRETASIVQHFDVRVGQIGDAVKSLSGGNQQKLVLGRELSGRPALLVVENPTRGLDFNATRFVHDALREARANGTAVVVYSSDLDEVLELADRVFVMRAGALIECARDRAQVGRVLLGAE